MRKVRIAGIILFCIMFVGFSAISYITPQKEYSDIENRSLETKPDFVPADILSGDYQEHYEKYLNDQMLFRDSWVELAVMIERLIGKKEVNGVYIGRDGYLLEKYSEADFEEAQIIENISILSSFLNDAADYYGKEHVACLMIPDKADAMPDKLPDYAGTGIKKVRSAMAELAEQLAEPAILLDTETVLRRHQDEYIYYRTDHHWTTLGAYYAYCAWADLTGHQAGKLEDYSRETVFDDFYGTTYNKVHVKVPMDSVELFHSQYENGVSVNEDDGEIQSDSFYFPEAATEGFNRYQVFLSKNTARIHITTKAQTGRSLLLVKDSFANCMVPFLAGDYDEIFMIDCRYGKENVRDFLAEHNNITDILVMYNVKNFMQDTNLHALDGELKKMEEFDADSFFDLP